MLRMSRDYVMHKNEKAQLFEKGWACLDIIDLRTTIYSTGTM